MPGVSTLASDSPAVGELLVLADEHTASRVLLAPRRGALVCSFRVGERELLFLDDATLRDPAKNVRGGIPVLFPSPGKLEGDHWQHAGRSGSMKQHGVARTEPWTVREVSPSAAHVSLALDANERTRAQFPWTFHSELDFTLEHTRLRIDFRLQNRDSTSLPFALGYHPYFRVDDADKPETRIATGATHAFDNLTKRTGAFTGFDFRAPEVDLHLLDHGSSTSGLAFRDGSRIGLRASSELGLWVVWSLAGRPFICVEPWTAPGNALNSGERLLEIAPDATYESFFEIEYYV